MFLKHPQNMVDASDAYALSVFPFGLGGGLKDGGACLFDVNKSGKQWLFFGEPLTCYSVPAC